MGIAFSEAQWDKVRAAYRQWWQGTLERPLIPAVVRDRDPGRPQPDAPILSQQTCTQLDIPADALVDRLDYEFSRNTYLGDAFPRVAMACFGPGVIAAFLGARLDNSTGRVWFHADGDPEIHHIHFKFDPDNKWFRRVSDIYAAAMKRWQGQVLVEMTDLGGNLDILSTFRPSEKLLLDLYDHPEEVERLTWEAHEAWHRYYEALNDVLQPVNPGYTDWSGIYSETPGYILQCDFCYMISPEMFDSFVKPELTATCRRLDKSVYHLDGIGQLQHLDSLLSIPELDGVQWVPGDGKPDCAHWPEVYAKIRDAGKLIQLTAGGLDALDAVREQLGSAKGIQVIDAGGKDRDALAARLASYGIE